MSLPFPVTAQPTQLVARHTAAVSVARGAPDTTAADRREAQRRAAARADRRRAHAERVRDNTAARHPLALR